MNNSLVITLIGLRARLYQTTYSPGTNPRQVNVLTTAFFQFLLHTPALSSLDISNPFKILHRTLRLLHSATVFFIFTDISIPCTVYVDCL